MCSKCLQFHSFEAPHRCMKTTMGTTTIIVAMFLSFCSVTLSSEEADHKNRLWSNLTPLQLAAIEGRAEEVESILSQNREPANPNSGMSALQWAGLRGHSGVIRTLLRFGADPRFQDDENNTALHMAAVSGRPEVVQELVLAGADINARNNNNSTALHLAVGKQDFEMVKGFLRFGALTNLTDKEGRSPLDLALETDNLMIMALLRSSGASKIKYGKINTTPSTTVVPTTTKPLKIQLLKATRRPELRKLTEKEISMHEAAKQSLDSKIADLCAEGVDPNVADITSNGYTPLHWAASVNGKVALLALARCSANLNAKDFDGNTPLHIAVMKDFPWAADMLLILGANPDTTNSEGKSPKDLVTSDKNSGFKATFNAERMKWVNDVRPLSDSEKELLRLVKNGYYLSVADSCKKGVDVRVKDANQKHYTMLHYAVSIKNNIPGTIQMLLRCGADINARDAEGNTPLHLAALEKLEEPQRVLLLNGADPFIANRDGKTTYQILKESSPESIDSRLQWFMNSMPI